MATGGKIPTVGEYRGVPLHCDQSEARLAVVRRDIDKAHSFDDLDRLVPFASDSANAPEARLYAMAKSLAILDEAIENRAPRSRMTQWSRERIRASAAGVNSTHWRSRTHYCSGLDSRCKAISPTGPVRREIPLPDKY